MPASVEPVVHGALDFAELERLGLQPDDILDFSVNNNPFGPSPLVRQALSTVPLDRYPDRESLALRRTLAQRLNVSTDQILVGNGAAELIWLVAFAFLRAGDKVLLLGPTFGEYERSARLMNAAPQVWMAQPATGFSFNLPEVDAKPDSVNFRAVFICNPNNPTGQVLPRETLAAWAQKYPETLFIIDEAYLAFVPGLASALSLSYKNLLILRSMTKDCALAGLRLGYLIAHPTLAEAVTRIRPAWNVNAFAQTAGLAALGDESHQRETLAQLQTAKEGLLAGLKELGYVPIPSQTHYFLLPVGKAADFRQKLLSHGILVRDCASFGLPGYVRIATRKPAENQRLLQTLAKIR